MELITDLIVEEKFGLEKNLFFCLEKIQDFIRK